MKQGKHALVNFAVNHPKWVVIVAVLITIALAIPIPRAVIDTDPENMLEKSEEVRMVHERIKEEFSLYDHLVVGFVGDTDLMTPEFVAGLDRLVERVEEMEGVVADDIMAPSTVDDIYRTPDGILVVGLLTDDRDGYETQPTVSQKIAENPILRGKLGSADGRAVAIYIPLEEKKYAHDVAVAIEDEIAAIGGMGEYHIAGLPVAEETFGKEMFKQMGISAPMAGLLIFLLMLLFFRKVRVVLSPMIIAIMAVIWTMGLLVAFGFTVHIMSSMIPIFLMPIAVLNSIHILSEFHERYQKSKSQREAILSTMDELFKPMIFTSLTTVVGFGSLMFAAIPPVRVFGAFVALGVAISWFLSVTFNPAYAVLLPKKTLSTFGRMDEGQSFLGRVLPPVGRFAARARVPVIIVMVGLFAVAAYGITKIEVNDNPTKWFKPSHPIRIADQQLGKHLSGTYMAYLEFDATGTIDGSVKTPATLKFMEGLQNRMAEFDAVGSTTGITDIVKKVRFELKNGDSAAYIVPDTPEEIAQELFLYETSGGDPNDLFKFITPDGDKAVLWIQLRDGDNRAVDEVVQAANTYIERNDPPVGMTFHWGGLTYINVVWQEKMVFGMLEALLGSFVIVAIMMILLLRSVKLGLISMIPLTVTIALVYGAVGLVGKSYDMPIAVLSSMTLGLSIDFAIHFLKRGQEIYRRRKDLNETLEELFQEPARAISRNIVVIALGFVPLLFSILVPYVTVGSFFLAIMGLSGFATLIILPAMVRLSGEKAFWPWGAKASTWAQKAPATASTEKEMVS
ncbi:MAG: MMPL family transporter [Candidatus Zixiibacteriota bacterium]